MTVVITLNNPTRVVRAYSRHLGPCVKALRCASVQLRHTALRFTHIQTMTEPVNRYSRNVVRLPKLHYSDSINQSIKISNMSNKSSLTKFHVQVYHSWGGRGWGEVASFERAILISKACKAIHTETQRKHNPVAAALRKDRGCHGGSRW